MEPMGRFPGDSRLDRLAWKRFSRGGSLVGVLWRWSLLGVIWCGPLEGGNLQRVPFSLAWREHPRKDPVDGKLKWLFQRGHMELSPLRLFHDVRICCIQL
jgi:hypothetical protein